MVIDGPGAPTHKSTQLHGTQSYDEIGRGVVQVGNGDTWWWKQHLSWLFDGFRILFRIIWPLAEQHFEKRLF